ncbi:MAG: tetratricopeptide repeat protein [Acidobacteriaceae bacterium]
MKKKLYVSVLALAATVMLTAPVVLAQSFNQAQDSSQGTITIKDPAEYNAYTTAVSQGSPQAQAEAMEQFLQQYPQSVVKTDILQRLMGVYQQSNNMDKMLDAAKRLVQADPNNLRGLAAAAYLLRSQAGQKSNPADAQPLLDQAAQYGQQGLKATAPTSGPDAANFAQVKASVTPIFEGAIAADDLNKKDYAGAIQNFHAELHAMPAQQTTQANGLQDTYLLGNAYVQEKPQDMINAVWYLARAAAYAPEPFHTEIQKAAHYWYKKYHGGLDGFDQVQAQAKASLDPPAGFTIQPAPPPPSPQELAAQTVASTPDLSTLGLSDKEFILANGKPEDANKVWVTMKDVSTKVPGTVISATEDQVQLAVSDDAQQSKKADFTINMKKPLKKLPAVDSTVTYIATFDSYTQNPPMIIMKDGEAPVTPKAKPHPVHHRRAQ